MIVNPSAVVSYSISDDVPRTSIPVTYIPDSSSEIENILFNIAYSILNVKSDTDFCYIPASPAPRLVNLSLIHLSAIMVDQSLSG